MSAYGPCATWLSTKSQALHTYIMERNRPTTYGPPDLQPPFSGCFYPHVYPHSYHFCTTTDQLSPSNLQPDRGYLVDLEKLSSVQRTKPTTFHRFRRFFWVDLQPQNLLGAANLQPVEFRALQTYNFFSVTHRLSHKAVKRNLLKSYPALVVGLVRPCSSILWLAWL